MGTNPGILSADYKVAGGKLLRVQLSLVGDANSRTIESIKITGDFFMHPENAIENLENELTGLPFTHECVERVVTAFFNTEIEVLGAHSPDFVYVIMQVS